MPGKFVAEIKNRELIEELIGTVLVDIWFHPDEITLYLTKTPDVRSSAYQLKLRVQRNELQPCKKIIVNQCRAIPLNIPPKVIEFFDNLDCYEKE